MAVARPAGSPEVVGPAVSAGGAGSPAPLTVQAGPPGGPPAGGTGIPPGEPRNETRSALGPPPAGPGDAFARAVQQILYRLERLDPTARPLDPVVLELELATPEMPFVRVAQPRRLQDGAFSGPMQGTSAGDPGSPPGPGAGAGSGSGAGTASDGSATPSAAGRGSREGGSSPEAGEPRAVLLVDFGPRFPETAGHIIATWTREPGVQLQVLGDWGASPLATPGGKASGPAGAGTGPAPGLAAVVKDAWLWPGGGDQPARLLLVTEHYPAGGQPALRVTLLERAGGAWQAVWSLGSPQAVPAAGSAAAAAAAGTAAGTAGATGGAGGPGGTAAAPAGTPAGSSGFPAAGPLRQVEVAPDATWIDVVTEAPVPAGRWAAGPGGTGPAASGPAGRPVLVTPDGPVTGLWHQRWIWSATTGTYLPASTRPVDQPLSVLQAFITLVSRGDLAEAAALVRGQDPAVLAAGRDLLTQRPLGQGWRVEPAAGGDRRGPLVVTRSDGSRITVTFVEEPGPDGRTAIRIAAVAAREPGPGAR